MSIVLRALEGIYEFFDRMFKVAVRLRFNVLAVLLGAVLFGIIPQGQEMGISAADSTLARSFLLIAMVIWIFQSFYSARFLATKDLENIADGKYEKWFIREAPWFLMAISIAVAVKFYLILSESSLILSEKGTVFDALLENYGTWITGIVYIGLCVAAWFMVKVLRLVIPERATSRGLLRQKGFVHKVFSYWVPIVVFVWAIYDPVSAGFTLGAGAIAFLTLSTLSSLGTLLDIFNRKTTLPLVAILFFLAVGFSFSNSNHGIRIAGYDPLTELRFTSLLRIADSSGAFNADKTYLHDSDRRSSLRDAYLDWLMVQDTASEIDTDKQDPIKLVVVASEGGGIRAAYWTTTVLGALQDRSSAVGGDFSKSLFAISGVSGGSLGAVSFNAVLQEDGDCGMDERSFEACSQRALGHDFLGPTVVSMFFVDFLQRFLPFRLLPDRAAILEMSWEEGWARTFGSGMDANPLSAPFLSLWSGKTDTDKVWRPALLLNGLHQETGKRIITSNLQLNEPVGTRGDRDYYAFLDVIDFYADKFDCAIPASTAAHNSARFTYVSPLGDLASCRELLNLHAEICDADGAACNSNRAAEDEAGHLMDGGYFENYGAATAREVLEGLSYLVDMDEGELAGSVYPDDEEAQGALAREIEIRTRRKIEILVIQIANDTVSGEEFFNFKPDPEVIEIDEGGLHQSIGPLRGIYRSRISRGILATNELRGWVEGYHRDRCAGEDAACLEAAKSAFVLFDLKDKDKVKQLVPGNDIECATAGTNCSEWTNPPLGWSLSRHTQVTICEQLRNGEKNREAYGRVLTEFGYGEVDDGSHCEENLKSREM